MRPLHETKGSNNSGRYKASFFSDYRGPSEKDPMDFGSQLGECPTLHIHPSHLMQSTSTTPLGQEVSPCLSPGFIGGLGT